MPERQAEKSANPTNPSRRAVAVRRFLQIYATHLDGGAEQIAADWRQARRAVHGVGEQTLRAAASAAGLPVPPAHSGTPGRPRDADVDAAVSAYQARCEEMLGPTEDLSGPYAAGVRHAALAAATTACDHPGLHSAVISRCRRSGIPLPPRGRPGAAALAIEAVLVAVWRFQRDTDGRDALMVSGERWRPLLPEHASPAQLLLWRERARVRQINALPPGRRRAAVLRLAAQTRPA